jgi:hypothetical protein
MVTNRHGNHRLQLFFNADRNFSLLRRWIIEVSIFDDSDASFAMR